MRIWLDDQVGEAIRVSSVRQERNSGPALSCEAEYVSREAAKESVIASIGTWQQAIIIGFLFARSAGRERVRVCLLDIAELSQVIDAAMTTEDVVSIRDPSAMGGCTFDFSPDEAPNPHGTVVVLVTAWGEHEAMIEPLAERLGGAVFRQGQTADAYRK